ncbi:hypothetical protein ABT282_08760 [Streptomyces sp. NPDC000927]|uniref:hypothetical protein n=1 Tax=Streptomyces sp. NPDC000927 TaxID=3154371 RepID=UPI00331FB19F
MGYNFRTIQPLTETEREELNRLTRHALAIPRPSSFSPGQESKSQAAYEEAWRAVIQADPSDYQTNSVGLGVILESMGKLGMVHEAPRPAFPTLGEFGLDGHPDPEDDQLTAEQQAFLVAYEEVFSTDSGTGPIPWYKLDDDPWVITPREVKAALEVYDATPEELRREVSSQGDWWGRFVVFLRGVPDRGGMVLG